MRILFFSPYFYPYTSGVTTYPFKILSHLAKTNQITVLTFRHRSDLPDRERMSGLNIVRMPFNFKISKGFVSLQSLAYFIDYLKKSDLIILNIPNFEGLFLAFLAKLSGKKIVSIFHCQVFLGKGLSVKIINFFLNLSVFFQLALSRKIIAYTRDYVDSLSIGKIFKNKIDVVLPPIEKLEVDNKKLSDFSVLKGSKIWVGYAGRIAREKGLEYLIEAVNKLKDKNIVLTFAGPYGKDVAGEGSYYLEIKKLLTEYRLPHHFFGNLTTGNLGAFYKSIAVLVLASINQTEAFGMVQADAMLLNTPVIAANLPGVRIPVRLTGMGEIVEPKNEIQLSHMLKRVLANKKKYTNKELNTKAQHIFNIQKTYQFYDNLIATPAIS